jgi:cytochrome c oxidase assembly protein Cox11
MVLLGKPSMYRHGLETQNERLIMSHMVDMMNMVMFAFETIPLYEMIGCGIVNLVRVIT